MADIFNFFSKRSIQTKIFLVYFSATVSIACLVIFLTSQVLEKNVEYRLNDTLRYHQTTINNELDAIETHLRFYGQFVTDIKTFSDQLPKAKNNHTILAYAINFLRSDNMLLTSPQRYLNNKQYAKILKKIRLGLYSINLIEHNLDNQLQLSIDCINPIAPGQQLDECIIISFPLNQKFVNGLKERTGADISIIYKNKLINTSLEPLSLVQAARKKIAQLPLDALFKEDRSLITEWGSGHLSQQTLVFPFSISYKNVGFIAVSLPLKEVFVIQDYIYIYAGIFAIIMIVVVGFIYIYLSEKLTAPITELSLAANLMAKGELDQQIIVTSQDEVGNLQASFNKMAENLQKMTRNLQQSNKKIKDWNKTLEQKVQERAKELQEIQRQLNEAEKLSAIGELVSGVAHEINNPLSSIIGFAQILNTQTDSRLAKNDLNKIVQEAMRANKIVKNLLTYARKEEPSKQSTNINDIITQTVDLRAYECKVNDIEIIQDLDPALSATMADPHQIKQVLLNILNNALQAIQEREIKGKINISSEQNDNYIIIKISDNGQGISDDTLSQIFNPFFTTKEVGRGTGLGLSVSYGIIKEHGGSIAVESKVGSGTTFIISLPVLIENTATDLVPETETDAKVLFDKRILVIDDEVMVLNFFKRFLESHGCKVEVASNGQEGWRKLRKTKFDLIVSDIKMPVMDGKALYSFISVDMPEMLERLVFSTGALVDESTREFIERTGRECLHKPFELSTIKKVLCGVINRVSVRKSTNPKNTGTKK